MIKEMVTQLRLSLVFVVVFTVLVGLIYPGVMTLIGQGLFPASSFRELDNCERKDNGFRTDRPAF